MAFTRRPKLILLDIEGTTSSISFVKQFLFPYVENNINQYLDKNWDDPNVHKDIQLLREQSISDIENGLSQVPRIGTNDSRDKLKEEVINNVLWQMATDRKTTALKQFQGNVWRFGYECGDIKGHDVPKAMAEWRDLGIRICIYSSGSVLAQKLLFRHSVCGDLTPLIDDYFDTTIGSKVESQSYVNISKACDISPNDILFVTDVSKEAIAARIAGLEVVLSVREGTEALSDEIRLQFKTIISFADIAFDN